MSFFERAFVAFWALGVVIPVVLRANGYAIDILGHSAVLLTLAEIPTSCNDTCNAVLDNINSCATFQCLCTTANTNGITACVDCIEAVKPNQTVIESAQDIIDQYASLCNQGGIAVPTQTASGFTGVVGSATGTGAVNSNSSPSASLTASTTPSLSSSPATATTGIPTESLVSSGFSLSGSAASTSASAVSATATSPITSSVSASIVASSSTGASPSPTTSSNGAQGMLLGSWAAGTVVAALTAVMLPVF